MDAGRIAGPFHEPPTAPFIVSHTGTVPKKGTTEVRRIHHLSHPHCGSVNDYIDDVPLSYASFNNAVALTRRLGSNALFAKIDVKAAFRCVAVHTSNRWLLGLQWCGSFYADLALPFGLKSSPAIWERNASLAEWLACKHGAPDSIH